MGRTLLILIWLLMSASAGSAWQSMEPVAPVQPVEPAARIRLSRPTAGPVAVSPDGDAVYVVTTELEINLIELAVVGLQSVTPALVGVMALWLCLKARRVRRTAQLPGEPHCRRCNYCLKGQAGARCSECGADTARVQTGRTFWRRMSGGVGAFAGVLIASLLLGQVQRGSSLLSAIACWSLELPLLTGGTLASFEQPVSCVRRVDLALGAAASAERLTGALRGSWNSLHVTRDGAGLLIVGPEVVLIDALSGQVRRRMTVPEGRTNLEWRAVNGVHSEGSSAYFVSSDLTPECVVYEWDLVSGACRERMRIAADFEQLSGQFEPPALLAANLNGQDVFISWPAAVGSPEAACQVRVWAADSGRLLHEFRTWLRGGLGTPLTVFDGSIIRVGEGWFGVMDPAGASTVYVRPSGGEFANSVQYVLGNSEWTADRFIVPIEVPESGFRLPYTSGIGIGIGRLVDWRWIAACRLPEGAMAVRVASDHDAQVIAAQVWFPGAGFFSPGYYEELVIYDLRSNPPPAQDGTR